jgi:hypothetical protein
LIRFGQVRVRLQHQRDRAGDDRRRHAGAAQREIRLERRALAGVEEGRGLREVKVLPGTASDTVPTPGATRSGLASKSMKDGPEELKLAISSS